MSSDISPELLKAIQTAFDIGYGESDLIRTLLSKVQSGNATYEEANLFAETVGELLSSCYHQKLSSEVLPDGKMYYNIAKKIVEPTMKNNYELISDYSVRVQGSLNKKANIGIKTQTAELDQSRIDGLINKMVSAKQYDDASELVEESVINFSQSVVDDVIKANVEFQYKAGLHPKLIRKMAGGCCEWCAELSGEYDYPNVPKDIYRIHRYCRCRVEYDPADGRRRRQNVHDKQWRNAGNDDIIEKRKLIGLKEKNDQSNFKRKVVGLKLDKTQITGIAEHVFEQIEERGLREEDIVDTIKKPLLIKDIKYDELNRPSFQAVGKRSTISVNPENGIITTAWKTSSKLVNKLER